ncbi:chaplin [Streptomyces sp. GC420]|uniref:chaplin n=1 Tax=Streptomyces sp. GC420 TaxID=2697568 RepID=UPI001AA16696|nr:chaplin [Streptomyces sp. GC420]
MRMIKKAALVLATAGIAAGATAGTALADSGAQGAAIGSPGVLSGNVIQVPVHVPVNVCGNSISVVGLLNPSFGNTCVNN